MLYFVRKWRFSDLNLRPSSRQIRKSGVIDLRTGTAGSLGSGSTSTGADDTPDKAAWISDIRGFYGANAGEELDVIPKLSGGSLIKLEDLVASMFQRGTQSGVAVAYDDAQGLLILPGGSTKQVTAASGGRLQLSGAETSGVLLAQPAVEPVGQPGVEEHLDQDRHRQHGDHQRLADDGLALEGEQQHQREQQRRDRQRADALQRPVEGGLALAQQRAAPELGQDDRNHDVQTDRYQ